MNNQLPNIIEPFKLVDQSLNWSGEILVGSFSRVVQVLAKQDDALVVQVDLRIYRDDFKPLVWVEANLSARLPLECQRCLSAVETDLAMESKIALLRDDRLLDTINDEDDFLVAGEDQHIFYELDDQFKLNLLQLLENELLVSMPLVPKHDVCPSQLHREMIDVDTEVKDNPFAVLAKLKKQ